MLQSALVRLWTDDVAIKMVAGFSLGGIMTRGPLWSTIFPLDSAPSSGVAYLISACQRIDNRLTMLVT